MLLTLIYSSWHADAFMTTGKSISPRRALPSVQTLTSTTRASIEKMVGWRIFVGVPGTFVRWSEEKAERTATPYHMTGQAIPEADRLQVSAMRQRPPHIQPHNSLSTHQHASTPS